MKSTREGGVDAHERQRMVGCREPNAVPVREVKPFVGAANQAAKQIVATSRWAEL